MVILVFINEYGFRLNRLFIEYLFYLDEVMKLLINGYLVIFIIVFVLLLIFGVKLWGVSNFFVFEKENNIDIGFGSRLVVFLIFIVVVFFFVRGIFGYRLINFVLVYFLIDLLVNFFILNLIYSVVYVFN